MDTGLCQWQQTSCCILGRNPRDQETQGSRKKWIKSVKLLNQALLSHFQQETKSGCREVGEQFGVAGLKRVRGRKIMTILARIPCYGLPCSKHSCVHPPGQQVWDLHAIICLVPTLWIKKHYKSTSGLRRIVLAVCLKKSKWCGCLAKFWHNHCPHCAACQGSCMHFWWALCPLHSQFHSVHSSEPNPTYKFNSG